MFGGARSRVPECAENRFDVDTVVGPFTIDERAADDYDAKIRARAAL